MNDSSQKRKLSTDGEEVIKKLKNLEHCEINSANNGLTSSFLSAISPSDLADDNNPNIVSVNNEESDAVKYKDAGNDTNAQTDTNPMKIVETNENVTCSINIVNKMATDVNNDKPSTNQTETVDICLDVNSDDKLAARSAPNGDSDSELSAIQVNEGFNRENQIQDGNLIPISENTVLPSIDDKLQKYGTERSLNKATAIEATTEKLLMEENTRESDSNEVRVDDAQDNKRVNEKTNVQDILNDEVTVKIEDKSQLQIISHLKCHEQDGNQINTSDERVSKKLIENTIKNKESDTEAITTSKKNAIKMNEEVKRNSEENDQVENETKLCAELRQEPLKNHSPMEKLEQLENVDSIHEMLPTLKCGSYQNEEIDKNDRNLPDSEAMDQLSKKDDNCPHESQALVNESFQDAIDDDEEIGDEPFIDLNSYEIDDGEEKMDQENVEDDPFGAVGDPFSNVQEVIENEDDDAGDDDDGEIKSDWADDGGGFYDNEPDFRNDSDCESDKNQTDKESKQEQKELCAEKSIEECESNNSAPVEGAAEEQQLEEKLPTDEVTAADPGKIDDVNKEVKIDDGTETTEKVDPNSEEMESIAETKIENSGTEKTPDDKEKSSSLLEDKAEEKDKKDENKAVLTVNTEKKEQKCDIRETEDKLKDEKSISNSSGSDSDDEPAELKKMRALLEIDNPNKPRKVKTIPQEEQQSEYEAEVSEESEYESVEQIQEKLRTIQMQLSDIHNKGYAEDVDGNFSDSDFEPKDYPPYDTIHKPRPKTQIVYEDGREPPRSFNVSARPIATLQQSLKPQKNLKPLRLTPSDSGLSDSSEDEYQKQKKLSEPQPKIFLGPGSGRRGRRPKYLNAGYSAPPKKSPYSSAKKSTKKEMESFVVSGSDEEYDSDVSRRRRRVRGKKKYNDVLEGEHPKVVELRELVSVAGIRINARQFLRDCTSTEEKCEKLLNKLRENGLKGEPTRAACLKIKKNLEIAREIAELKADENVIQTGSRLRQRRTNTNYYFDYGLFNDIAPPKIRHSPSPETERSKKSFSRIKMVADSSSDSD